MVICPANLHTMDVLAMDDASGVFFLPGKQQGNRE